MVKQARERAFVAKEAVSSLKQWQLDLKGGGSEKYGMELESEREFKSILGKMNAGG